MFFVPIPRSVAKERGLKTYFTGKPCSLNNVFNKLVSSYNCQCPDHLLAKQVQRSTPEVRKREIEYAKQWAKNNPEKVRLSKKRHAKKQSKIIVQRVLNWSKSNPEKVRQNSRNSYLRHKRIRSETSRSWRLKNKPLIKMYEIKRRCLELNAKVFDNELTQFVVKEAYLLSKSRENLLGFKWHLDHMIPLVNKTVCGLHVWNNFQVIPQIVNNSKSNRLIYTNPHEWLYDIPKFFKVVYQKEIAA